MNKYSHITKAFIDIISLRWSRIEVAGVPHKWSFVRDGEEKGLVSCSADKTAGLDDIKVELEVGMKDLLGMLNCVLIICHEKELLRGQAGSRTLKDYS